ncbi:MAG: hypothetical protein K0V04_38440 [Deltaproteobacteria bacterium]|nr:hypothetical protein [Deltaproteobacteria bacterium]
MGAKEQHTFGAFEALANRVRTRRIRRWAAIESDFLRAVERFDTEYSRGKRDSGWYKSKARYFNEIALELVANASGKEIAGPVHRQSQLFHKIDIDICYPAEGDPITAAEVKALGTPPHPGNGNKARRGSSDLHKRVREVALTAIDIKAAYARPVSIKSFRAWVERTEPAYFSFWAIRTENQGDFESVRSILVGLRSYCNGVGAILYSPTTSNPMKYCIRKVPELKMDNALREMAQRTA